MNYFLDPRFKNTEQIKALVKPININENNLPVVALKAEVSDN